MANRNAAVVEILKLAYEFENSVSRPGDHAEEAARWFSDAIYEPTLLDTALLPDVLEDEYDLVLLTGNPGDGKSAFVGRLIEHERTRSGRPIYSKHDATEPDDPEDRAASALRDLEAFLRPYSVAGWNPDEAREAVYLVGINKGLLVRAFLGPDAPFARLRDAVRAAQARGTSQEPVRLALVDLNQRAEATLPLDGDDSLFDRILTRLTASGLWEEQGCEGCEDAGWCPFFANAKALRDGVPRQRLKLLWLIQQLRGERHATIRDLLAALAYVMVGHEDMFHEGDSPDLPILHPCAFVEREATADDEWIPLFRRLLFNSAFVDDDVFEEKQALVDPNIAPSAARTFGMAPDLIREHLNDLDPSHGMSNDYWDRIEERTLANPTRVLGDLVERSERRGSRLEASAFRALRDRLDELAAEMGTAEASDPRYQQALDAYQWVAYLVERAIKRRAYFADGEARLEDLTSYASLESFLSLVRYLEDRSRGGLDAYEVATEEVVPRGLMGPEGRMVSEERPRSLEVRWSPERVEVGAFLGFPLRGHELEAVERGSRYVETFPTRIAFVPFPDRGSLSLTMSLDTFEALARLARGYDEAFAGVEKTSQLRAFREALRGVHTDELAIVDLLEPTKRLDVAFRERIRFD